ncbi:MAG TPA: hypothetical protein VFA63_09690 [Pseudonocardiaceae bacterium]|nr:hypothetical protein [Pseudonocardiaceae bacterium]
MRLPPALGLPACQTVITTRRSLGLTGAYRINSRRISTPRINTRKTNIPRINIPRTDTHKTNVPGTNTHKISTHSRWHRGTTTTLPLPSAASRILS